MMMDTVIFFAELCVKFTTWGLMIVLAAHVCKAVDLRLDEWSV